MFSNACTSFIKISSVNVVKLQNIRNVHKNHYQVLGLSKNCCTKDIKDAFVKLSKTCHPDVSSDGLAHHQFLRVSEAYNVLSKPVSRKIYDMELNLHSRYGDLRSIKHRPRPRGYDYESTAYWSPRQRYREPFYEKQNHYNHASRNKMVALMCLLISAVGAIIQFCAIRHSVTLKRDFLLARSLENEIYLTNLQSDAERNGNELQLQLLEQRICK